MENMRSGRYAKEAGRDVRRKKLLNIIKHSRSRARAGFFNDSDIELSHQEVAETRMGFAARLLKQVLHVGLERESVDHASRRLREWLQS